MAGMRHGARPFAPRAALFSVLFGLFLLCFAFTPLWTRFPSPFARGAALACTLAAGALWAWLASGPLRLPALRRIAWLAPILLFAALLNLPALSASLPWRGDEDHHVVFAMDLAKALRGHGLSLSESDYWFHVLRYPILLKYLTAVPVCLYSFLPDGLPPEIPYRLLPLLSAAVLAWLGFHFLRRHPLPLRLAAALSVLTLPLVRYYSSIFYLEMPAAACMAWVCFQAPSLLRAEPSRLARMPAWYALLLLGFLKETALPFLLAFLCVRLICRIRLRPSPWWRELAVPACVLLPLALYLAYRSRFGDFRAPGLHHTNLFDLHLPVRLALSLWESFGPLLPLALAGAASLAARGRWAPLAFLSLACAGSAALHYLDDHNFIGYSRFNLFLLPGLLALAWEAVRRLQALRPRLAAPLLAAAVGMNVILSPVNADGSKRPFWGVYGVDVGEHYYPYRQALAFLEARHGGVRVRLTGHHYRYFAAFYTGRADWPEQVLMEPQADETAQVEAALAAAERDGVEAVLYQLRGEPPRLPAAHGYARARIFRNRAHALVLFSRE